MSTAAGRARILCVVLLLAGHWPHQAHADARSDYLGRLLQSSTQFRVRAQAAISLGRVTGEPVVSERLVAALNDEHPAVRAAAASSLARLGDVSVVPALRARRADAHAEVRSAVATALAALESSGNRTPSVVAASPATVTPLEPGSAATFYVGVGLPGSRVQGVSDDELKDAQAFLRSHVQAIAGVVLAPEGEQPRQAESVIRTRKLTGYFVDSSIVSVEVRANGGTRVAVSVIVGTYPGRDMRSILQGAATVMGGGAGARDQAIEAAFSGALRNLTQAMAAGRR